MEDSRCEATQVEKKIPKDTESKMFPQFVLSNETKNNVYTRWWFQIILMFTPTWGNDPI